MDTRNDEMGWKVISLHIGSMIIGLRGKKIIKIFLTSHFAECEGTVWRSREAPFSFYSEGDG